MNKAILLKVDDFFDISNSGRLAKNFDRFMNITCKKGIKISLGIIGCTLDKCPPSIIRFVKNGLGDTIELYNHSFTHSNFMPRISEGNKKIKEVFDVDVEVFGAPFNDVNASIINELQRKENNQLTSVYFYRDEENNIASYHAVKKVKKLIEINGYKCIENYLPENYSYVRMDNFHAKYDPNFIETKIYQLHPFGWSEKDFTNFDEILGIMIKDGRYFVFPTEL